MSALQTSLDILRKNRPDYTPRQGFVWPIVGDAAQDDAGKKKAAAASEDAEEPSTASITPLEPTPSTSIIAADSQPSQANPTKSQTSTDTASAAATALKNAASTSSTSSGKRINTALLLNAMHTTAMNSKIQAHSFAEPIADSAPPSGTVTNAAETPASTAQMVPVRSSATPAPGQQEREIKGTAPGDAAARAGKKKRKSE